MVRVVEKSLEERAQEEKCEQLAEIARQVVGQPLLVAKLVNVRISDPHDNKTAISVDPYGNVVRVFDQKYFDIAMRLATAYEEKLKGQKEFTVKKDY